MTPKAAPKVKKAMNKPPAAATRSHDAYPGEHLGSKATSSRKRASDFYEGDEADPETKPTESKATKTKKTKTATATTSNHTKPSKVDGHPVEIEKTHPGGDTVEVEPRKRGRPSKTKDIKENQSALPESTSSSKGHTTKSKKGDDVATKSAGHAMPDADGDDSAPVKSKKEKKGAAKDKKAPQPTKSKAKTSETAETDVKGKDPKVEAAAEEVASQPTAKSTKAKKAKKATENGDDGLDPADVPSVNKAPTTAQSKKSKKAKAPAEPGSSEDKDVNIAPEQAMDESVFDSLLSTDKGKDIVDEGQLTSEKPKPGKANKKVTKGQAKVGTSSKDDAKPSNKPKATDSAADDKEAPVFKSKKRKSPPIDDTDAVKADVLDPLNEVASAKKKQKKSRPSALGAVGDGVGSLLSSVKKNAKAAIDFAGNVAGGGQDSIMDDVQGVAEGAVEEKRKQTSPKAPKDEVPSEETLLKGMESSGDEKDPDEDEGFDQGQVPPALPKSTFDKINAISHPSTDSKSEGGVVYVGRIPHGFYEHEMRAYFSQFGNISRLRLSRNKTTGASRHYAFIEFDSEEVAKIVAETMNNYLLFGHILKVHAIDSNQLHPNIWKGANKRFKKVPWAQIEGRKLAQPMSREQWEKRVEGEQKKRKDKAEKMKAIGYEFDAPLKSVDQVPVRETKNAIEDGSEEALIEEEKTLVTGPGEEGSSMVISESTTTKKIRKPSAKAKEIENTKDAAAAAGKKGKRKAEDALEKAKEGTNVVSEPVSKKAKKAKAAADEVVDPAKDIVENAAAPAVSKAKKTGEQAAEKAKESIDKAGPLSKKAKKASEDVVAPAVKKSKKSAQDATDKVKDSANSVAEEAAGKTSEATAAATGTTKKSKKAKA